jgi:integrase
MRDALKMVDMRPHDFRRTGATNLTGERLGFPRFTVSKVLNHASDTGNAAAVTSV